ncbi:MAG: hypothetical protein JW902_07460 [Syntrophaceae bacterium]|nr:hypothetical protein [Syntrophaceae bacterium]
MGIHLKNDSHFIEVILAFFLSIFSLTGCATTAMETHEKGMESITEQEYFIPKKPIDRHYIGCAWSKQFGPVEDPAAADIRIKVEKSFDAMQQAFAFNAGISLGGKSSSDFKIPVAGDSVSVDVSTDTSGWGATGGIEGGKSRQAALEDVQIISPVSLADIPFEPNIPYITEALRLGHFTTDSRSGVKAGVTAGSGGTLQGGIKGDISSAAGTKGQGLVVAYKLHMIDTKTYTKQESSGVPLELNKTKELPGADMYVTAQLRMIEAGASKSLPRNLLWACDEANAKSRDVIAAWIIDLRPKNPKRKSLQIAFPAFPKMEECRGYSGVIYSRIDPLTDKIIRQKINIIVFQEDVSDSLQPVKWNAKMSLVDESFNIRLVKKDDLYK